MAQAEQAEWARRTARDCEQGKPKPAPAAPALERPSGMPRLFWEILCARGIGAEGEMQKWLSPSLKSLRDPFVLRDMEAAVARLALARQRQETVCIYADYDLDGTSACALLKQALEWLGFERVTHYQPSRLVEGYGLHEAALRKIAAAGATLVVTVDLGITAIREAEVARELGVDLIITDHHLPKDELPAALAVVNPNRADCASGLGHLCGTGVAFYLALALRRSLQEAGVVAGGFEPKALLDCFVIGTLTDMVPLVEENRVLVKHGLLALARTQRPGLRALLQSLKLWGQPLTSQDVAIRFAPKLNALSRMELGAQPIDLYLVQDEREARRLVAEVLANNQTRVSLQREAERAAAAEIGGTSPEGCAVIASRSFHRGVVGLVATRVCQEHGVPAFVGAVDESGKIVGSGRAPEGVNLLEALEAAGDALAHFGGHAAAAGFELRAKNLNLFTERARAFFLARGPAAARMLQYDAECELRELSPEFMAWYDCLAPFGAKFPAPLLRLRGARIEQVRELNGGHLRLSLGPVPGPGSSGAFASVPSRRSAVWFAPPARHPARASLRGGAVIEALVEPQWNWFNGQKSLQLMVRDLRPASEQPLAGPVAVER
jgi:single-stranded-DNA-specific exonuclease